VTKASQDPANAEHWLPPSIWPTALAVPARPPRLVYLDLNHWINLARAAGGSGRPGYADLHRELLVRRDAGEIRVVLSGALFREVSKIADPAQRSRLTVIIEELTDFHYLLDLADVLRLEVETSLDARLGQLPRDRAAIALVGTSGLHAFGRRGGLRIEHEGLDVTDHALSTNPTLAQRWPDMLREAERGLLAGPQDDEIPVLRANGYRPEIPVQTIKDNAAYEAEWSERINPYRSTHAIRDIVLARHLALELLDFCTPDFLARGVTIGAVGTDPAALREFVMAMPSSCVFVSLLAQWHRQREHKWQENDVYDIDALSVALPYCDIVFADAAMRSAAMNAGLGEHFQTDMPRTPQDLIYALQRM
jgi:hypothetical protein